MTSPTIQGFTIPHPIQKHKHCLTCNNVVDLNFLLSLAPPQATLWAWASSWQMLQPWWLSFSLTTLQARGFSPTALIIPPSGPCCESYPPSFLAGDSVLPWESRLITIAKHCQHTPRKDELNCGRDHPSAQQEGMMFVFFAEIQRGVRAGGGRANQLVLNEEQIKRFSESRDTSQRPVSPPSVGGTGQPTSHNQYHSELFIHTLIRV